MSTLPNLGHCPTCGSIAVTLVRHHCHLCDVVSGGIRSVLLPVLGGFGIDGLFGIRNSRQDEPRVVEFVRFPPILICATCNEVDGCFTDGRPGPYFSLAPDEIWIVRMANDFRENSGAVFVDSLAKARRRAARSYFERAPFASPLGGVIAREWLDDEFEKVTRDVVR